MAFQVVFKVYSKINPTKIYNSAAEFWYDHKDSGVGDENKIIENVVSRNINELKNTTNLNARYIAQGKLISDASSLGDDGKHVIYTKIYSNRDAYLDYIKDYHDIPNVLDGEENTITMVKVSEQERY